MKVAWSLQMFDLESVLQILRFYMVIMSLSLLIILAVAYLHVKISEEVGVRAKLHPGQTAAALKGIQK